LQHENREHLALMETMLGPIPESMIRRARGPCAKFFRNGRLQWPGPKTPSKSIASVDTQARLEVRSSFFVVVALVAMRVDGSLLWFGVSIHVGWMGSVT